jgi:hypothetical protein
MPRRSTERCRLEDLRQSGNRNANRVSRGDLTHVFLPALEGNILSKSRFLLDLSVRDSQREHLRQLQLIQAGWLT